MVSDGKPSCSSQHQISITEVITGLRESRVFGRSYITAEARKITLLLLTISSITDDLFHLQTHDCEDDTLIVLAFEDPDSKDEPTDSKKPDDSDDSDDNDDTHSKTLKEDSDDNDDMKIIRAQFL